MVTENKKTRKIFLFRIIVLVTVERMSAVLWPLKARIFWTKRKLLCFVICIFVASILTSMPLHISYKVTIVVRNETIINSTTGIVQFTERSVIKPMIRQGWQDYWRIATLLDTIFLVIIPVLIVVIATSSIVITLHKRRPGSIFLEKEPHQVRTESIDSPIKHSAMNNSGRSQRRATFIVVVIAGSFTICQLPSAFTHFFLIIRPNMAELYAFDLLSTLSNSLVVTTKALNFFLFCMWSANFRRNLRRIIIEKLETLKETWWMVEPKAEFKLKDRLNYSEPSVPNKPSFSYLIRPPFLQICHSLPPKLENTECVEMEKLEHDELLK